MTKRSKQWMQLDNAAKIYPASMRRNWNALFRVSATLTETIDKGILEKALASTLCRFPSFSVRLRRGLFWYYLEHKEGIPAVEEDVCNPCVRMRFKENNDFLFRVRYYQNRIAVEIFHVIADGTGGLCFLQTLVAEYIRLRYGGAVPRSKCILDCSAPATKDETEDSFIPHANSFSRSRSEPNAYYIQGTDEENGFVNITTGIVDADRVLELSHEKRVSLTEFIASVMIASIDRMQRRECKNQRHLKPVKINVPINLRRFFKTNTMRNFASYANPGIESKYGEYTLDEILLIVHHFMGMEVTQKMLNAKISTNVKTAENPVLRFMPLFVKNAAMKLAFNLVGDRKTSSSLSNLGVVHLPDEMARYVTRMDFILGPLSRNKDVCAALTYNGKIYLNFTRTIKESDLEREFFTSLVKLGIPVLIESNQR